MRDLWPKVATDIARYRSHGPIGPVWPRVAIWAIEAAKGSLTTSRAIWAPHVAEYGRRTFCRVDTIEAVAAPIEAVSMGAARRRWPHPWPPHGPPIGTHRSRQHGHPSAPMTGHHRSRRAQPYAATIEAVAMGANRAARTPPRPPIDATTGHPWPPIGTHRSRGHRRHHTATTGHP